MSADLLAAARQASNQAYAPYSHFRVGAAVRAGDAVFTGANIENASYGLTICAERTALFAAILAQAGPIAEIALACVDAPPDAPPNLLMPCGACRQVMAEFAPPTPPSTSTASAPSPSPRSYPSPFACTEPAPLTFQKMPTRPCDPYLRAANISIGQDGPAPRRSRCLPSR